VFVLMGCEGGIEICGGKIGGGSGGGGVGCKGVW